ncbi:hypothetical protein [Flavobacterium sp. 1355]|jgi:hypothetical protein|uniref:hypothetical protein n=1 Tax=Flavobacterium sp. 1355 TaxID=2806571 RepID=UPI001AE747B0|nr:hypothetical protein [Flavobacterium sp. 1355]MBP1223070.1 hypothetical protein [Flavobacterium sp. 1355]
MTVTSKLKIGLLGKIIIQYQEYDPKKSLFDADNQKDLDSIFPLQVQIPMYLVLY